MWKLVSSTAIDKVREVSNVEKINTLGFCIGGTLLTCAAGVIAKQKRILLIP